ncbi:hypothetical protein E4H12_10105 [Candidatus Thorarchaeota archaeon]|nr:hypothetical protein [Candidatus Thorarchaeota archaeon]TFG96851.1 MAG: hypothetical protein E4H12_10105 [Candidatus Thorarchaeota archaeon]
MLSEPELTPSVLGTIPDLMKEIIAETMVNLRTSIRKSILVSSNSLANRFIILRWGIRPSQRRRYKNLFSTVRIACRDYFRHLLLQGRISNEKGKVSYDFVVYKFDEIRGNLILGFAAHYNS